MNKKEFYKKMGEHGRDFWSGRLEGTLKIIAVTGIAGILFPIIYFFYEQGQINKSVFIALLVFLILGWLFSINRFASGKAEVLTLYGQKMSELSKSEPRWTKKERIMHATLAILCCIFVVTIFIFVIINQMHGGRGLIPAGY